MGWGGQTNRKYNLKLKIVLNKICNEKMSMYKEGKENDFSTLKIV